MRRFSLSARGLITLAAVLLPGVAWAEEAPAVNGEGVLPTLHEDPAAPTPNPGLVPPAEAAAAPDSVPDATPMTSAISAPDRVAVKTDFTAKLRVMNRKLESNADLALTPRKTTRYDTLTLTALACIRDAQGIRDNTLVFLRIEDEGRPLFNGWMSQQFPGVSLLEHPHYSVVVLGCM